MIHAFLGAAYHTTIQPSGRTLRSGTNATTNIAETGVTARWVIHNRAEFAACYKKATTSCRFLERQTCRLPWQGWCWLLEHLMLCTKVTSWLTSTAGTFVVNFDFGCFLREFAIDVKHQMCPVRILQTEHRTHGLVVVFPGIYSSPLNVSRLCFCSTWTILSGRGSL